jgi:hypothetical protein
VFSDSRIHVDHYRAAALVQEELLEVRDRETLVETIAAALADVTPEVVKGWFPNCGYELHQRWLAPSGHVPTLRWSPYGRDDGIMNQRPQSEPYRVVPRVLTFLLFALCAALAGKW